ncbi:hypothetical protein BH23VER1_BH23VER1_12230 [soil metagenome]
MKPNTLRAAILSLALVALPGIGHAIVDDAHSFAMEAATPYVKQGFRVRSDYWSGEIELGEQKAIRHQLFKGNNYCFWLGTDADGVALQIGIYDIEGNPMAIQVVDGNHAMSARILPPSTGYYVIVFSIQPATKVGASDEESESVPVPVPVPKEVVEVAEGTDEAAVVGPVGWALAYGYK